MAISMCTTTAKSNLLNPIIQRVSGLHFIYCDRQRQWGIQFHLQ
jgi:hypothetical protein